jgi:hypothetical protein
MEMIPNTYDNIRNSIKKNKYVAGIVVVCVFLMLFVRMSFQYSVIQNKEDRVKLLEDTYQSFKEEYEVLYDRYLNLTAYYNDSIDKNVNLLNDIINLEFEIGNLSIEYGDVMMTIDELRSELNHTNERYITLLNNYTDLSNEFYIIQSELHNGSAFKEISFLEENRIISLGPGEDVVLNYAFSYSGYLEVNFTSTNEVYFWFGSSIVNDFYSRYPLWPEVSINGSCKIPICKDIYVYIKNPNDTSITIDLSMKVVY